LSKISLEKLRGSGSAMREQQLEIVIEPGKYSRQYWRDLWLYRELFYFLAWRDIKVRYKQTVMGVAWAVVRPVLTMIVFSVIFGKLAGLPSGEAPYPIMVFAALLPWQFFAQSLGESSNSLITNVNLISKIYMPRLILPASTVVVSLVDFLISFAILALMMAGYRFMPPVRILTIPLFLLLALLTSYGFSLWFGALNVKYRDFRYIVPFIVQFGLYVSPVGFSSNVVPEKWRLLYSMNPMVGVIDGFRWAILGGDALIYWPGFILSIVLTFIVFISGLWYFRSTERTFADII
jgi:lipopolysaccharide transport system permease protein